MAFIIINADDFGLSDGVCRSIRELFDAGAVSNTTLMLAADGGPARMVKWRVKELVGHAGVHLQLTGGVPLSPIGEVQSLVNPKTGRFWAPKEIKNPNPHEVELEWVRQIETAYELLDGAPTHLDSHHGVARIPECVEVFVSLAARFGLSIRGASGETEKTMEVHNVHGTTDIIRDWTGSKSGPEQLVRAVEDKAAAGSVLIEVMTHPGYNDEYLQSVLSLNEAREYDHSALLELAQRGWPASNGHQRAYFPGLDTQT